MAFLANQLKVYLVIDLVTTKHKFIPKYQAALESICYSSAYIIGTITIMGLGMKNILLFTLFGLLLPLVANAGKSDRNSYTDNITIPAGGKVAILPMEYQYSDMQANAEIVGKQLNAQLQALGFTVENYNDKEVFLGLLAKVYQLDPAMITLLQQDKVDKLTLSEVATVVYQLLWTGNLDKKTLNYLQTEMATDVFIQPRLFSTSARVSGRIARWDGVRGQRFIKGTNIGQHYMSKGSTQAFSLELKVYQNDLVWQFTSYGGVALPTYVNFRKAEIIQKKNFYNKKKIVKDGVAATLLPIEEVFEANAKKAKKKKKTKAI